MDVMQGSRGVAFNLGSSVEARAGVTPESQYDTICNRAVSVS